MPTSHSALCATTDLVNLNPEESKRKKIPPGAAGQQTNWLLLGTTSGGMFLICRPASIFRHLARHYVLQLGFVFVCLALCPSPCVCVCFRIFFCIYKMLPLLCTLFLSPGFGSDLASAQPLKLSLSMFGHVLYWLWCSNLWWHVFVPNFLPSDFLVLRFGLCHRDHDSSRPNLSLLSVWALIPVQEEDDMASFTSWQIQFFTQIEITWGLNGFVS